MKGDGAESPDQIQLPLCERRVSCALISFARCQPAHSRLQVAESCNVAMVREMPFSVVLVTCKQRLKTQCCTVVERIKMDSRQSEYGRDRESGNEWVLLLLTAVVFSVTKVAPPTPPSTRSGGDEEITHRVYEED